MKPSNHIELCGQKRGRWNSPPMLAIMFCLFSQQPKRA
jgi:hypothetical protein